MRSLVTVGLTLGVSSLAASASLKTCGGSDSTHSNPSASATGAGPSAGGTDSGPSSDRAEDASALADAGAADIDPCRAGVVLPADKHYVADGMCVRLVYKGSSGGLRQITFAPNGDLFGVYLSGSVVRLRDVDRNRVFGGADEVVEYAHTGGNGNNCDIDAASGFLYAGTPDGVKRWPYAPTAANGGAGEVVMTGQPSSGHSLHTVHVYDGTMYVMSGSSGNMTHDSPDKTQYDTTRSLVKRFRLSDFRSGTPLLWSAGDVWTVGLRNTVGFTRDAAGTLYGVVNGMDQLRYQGADVHIDNPGEQLVTLTEGAKYGYPFCFTAQNIARAAVRVPPGTQLVNADFAGGHDDAWCAANSSPPTTFFQAHSAPLDITFYERTDGVLPARWRGGAFVTLHGSWNRAPATGYKVVWVPFDAAGNSVMPTALRDGGTSFPHETVFGGGSSGAPVDGPWSWSASGTGENNVRPVGVAVSPVDGSLYVSSDAEGTIYRVGLKPRAR